VLEEHSGELLTRGFIDGLGKPGERLYAARFMGDRGYLVTFRTTDPLYVLDLADPANPRVLGELSIPGYSDYLHPVNDQLLLGIGKSAVADSSDADGRGAWYQGLKLALFSLRDPANPQQVSALDIGLRGTDSVALWDHHAVGWLPADNTVGRSARLTLPVSLHDRLPSWRQETTLPWQGYDWRHNGLYLLDIDEANESIRLVGKMVVEDYLTSPNVYGNTAGDRALLTADTVHYVHQSRVWSAPWQSPEQMTGPQ